MPTDILDWKIVPIHGIPKQSNGFDCGVFVLKYMEAALSPTEVQWETKMGWQDEMPRFRAEITADILRVFHDLVLANISGQVAETN